MSSPRPTSCLSTNQAWTSSASRRVRPWGGSMADLPIRRIEARTYCHATEDEQRVAAALVFAVPEGETSREELEGHFGNPLVRLTPAHVSGASYKMIGDPGLEFLEDFAQSARVSVPTTVNPLGTDLAQWQELGVPATFAEKQGRIARAYEAMGVRPTYSCTPYLLGVRPAFGEHIAWAESSAVCFANSVLGARTNREGGPAALAAAIVGATPEAGLHAEGGREPTVIVKVHTKPRGIDYSLIGLVAGERVGDGLSFFRGFRGTEQDLQWPGAALASSGACGMFHLEGVTPEARRAR